MGDNTPEAVELKCPGCGTHFRLTPKKGRLPTSEVPCPKCSEIIPLGGSPQDSAAGNEPESTTTSAPAFGVTAATKKIRKKVSEDSSTPLSEREKDAIARFANLTGNEGANSTIAGLPGSFDTNPFVDSSLSTKGPATGSIEKSVLDRLAADSSEDSDDSDEAQDLPAPSGSGVKVPHDTTEADGREPTRKSQRALTQTEENPSVPPEMAKHLRDQADKAGKITTSPSTEESQKSQILAKLQTKVVRQQLNPDGDHSAQDEDNAKQRSNAFSRDPTRAATPSLESRTSPSISLSRLRAAAREDKSSPSISLTPPRSSVLDEKSEGAADGASEDPRKKLSLAARFKKARQKGTGDAGNLRAKLRKVSKPNKKAPSPGDESLADGVDISEGEIADIVERTTSNVGLPSPKLTSPITSKTPKINKEETEKKKDTKEPDESDHSGLFERYPSTASDDSAESDPIAEVSKKSGTTSQSMLARLQKRRNRGDHVDPLEVGAAGERRGSGYIRLPTTEIQEVLGQGDFRLKIQGVIYEPVDRDGLTQLIKGGVLLGAEELAEAEGDWMPVSEHPVFGELRRKMATEAHQVLSRMGATQRNQPVSAPPEKPDTLEEPPPASTPTTTQPIHRLEREVEPTPEPDVETKPAAPTSVEPSVESKPVEPTVEAVETRSVESTPEPAKPTIEERPPTPEKKFDPPAPVDDSLRETASESLNEPSEPFADTLSSVPDSDAPPLTTPKRKGKGGLIAGILVVMVAAAAGGLILTEPGQSLIADLTDTPSSDSIAVEEPQEADPAVMEAIQVATAAVLGALPDAFSDPSLADEWAREQVEDSDYENVIDLLAAQWNEGRREHDFVLLYFDVLLENESHQMARRVALKGMELFPGDDEFVGAHRRAIKGDESLTSYQHTHLTEADQYTADGLYDVSGHRGVVLSMEGAETQYVFKPERSGWQDGWRAEVAAWRFCELVACHFEILKIEPAIMTRSFFDELSGDTEGLAALAEQASWQDIEIDGEAIQAVRGSLEHLPAKPSAAFPIEYTRLWLNWLAAGTDSQDLESTLAENLGSLQNLADGKFYEGLVSQVGDLPTWELARQVSSLLLFDFLTNNWERFFTRPEEYGTNNPVVGTTLVSRHNGDAFQPRASRRVQGRFEWTTRFSSSTVASIRALDRELVAEVLFPEATATERSRLNVMWSQRQQLLQRVDELTSRHGSEEVLLFP